MMSFPQTTWNMAYKMHTGADLDLYQIMIAGVAMVGYVGL